MERPSLGGRTRGKSLEERIEHRRREDKIRQRNRRDRVKNHIDSLEVENEQLRQRVADLEARCEHLRGIVSSVASIVSPTHVEGGSNLIGSRLLASPQPDIQDTEAALTLQPATSDPRESSDDIRVMDSMALTVPFLWPTWFSTTRDGPIWTQLPSHTPPTCLFDTMVSELDTLSQHLAKQGLLSIPELKAAAPAVSALVDAASTPDKCFPPTMDKEAGSPGPLSASQTLSTGNQHGFSLSNMLVDFVTMGMPALQTTLERLTAAWVVFNLIRWRICRSKEAFDALPPHYRPTQIQQSVSYPAWIDPIPWPKARDKIITELPPSQYPRFRTMLHETYAIRAWSKPVHECLERSTDGHWTLAPNFIRHLHDLRNLALTQKAVDEFPFLDGVVNIVPSPDSYALNARELGDDCSPLSKMCVNNCVPLFA